MNAHRIFYMFYCGFSSIYISNMTQRQRMFGTKGYNIYAKRNDEQCYYLEKNKKTII